jgi:teichuronic acid biosynthesis glycosyltransferase TuaG
MTSDVSVVIPYFNAKDTIGRALNSIKKQTLTVKEVIIVNDGSDLVTLSKIIEESKKYLNIILIDLTKNFGAAYARNIGVANSSAKFIAFLDADDVWHPEKISIQYKFMCKTGCFLTCHGYAFNLNTQLMVVDESMRARKLSKSDFLWRNHVFTPTVMVAKEQFIAFDQRLTRSEDLKCWISNFSNGNFFYLTSKLAGGYKRAVGESGLSGSYNLMHKEYLNAWEILFSEREVGLVYYFIAIVVEYVKYPMRLLLSWTWRNKR